MNGRPLRIGVVFGGRSSEHEVHWQAPAMLWMLAQAGHYSCSDWHYARGRWLTKQDPMKLLTQVQMQLAAVQRDGADSDSTASNGAASEDESWALLPHHEEDAPLPAIDVLWPVLHGPYGEDGTIQGMLEMANLPYVGCNVLASAVCMDKAMAKVIFAAAGLPQVPWLVVMQSLAEPRNGAERSRREAGDYPSLSSQPIWAAAWASAARNRDELSKALTGSPV